MYGPWPAARLHSEKYGAGLIEDRSSKPVCYDHNRHIPMHKANTPKVANIDLKGDRAGKSKNERERERENRRHPLVSNIVRSLHG